MMCDCLLCSIPTICYVRYIKLFVMLSTVLLTTSLSGHILVICCTLSFISEVVKSHLPEFLDWAVQIVASDDSDPTKVNLKLGALSALSAVYKHGKREDLRKAATTVLKVTVIENSFQYYSFIL